MTRYGTARSPRELISGLAGGRTSFGVPMEVDLEGCIRGDPEAWSVFVESSAGLILTAVRRALRGSGPSDVEDAVQDVYVRLVREDFRLLRQFDPSRAALSTWLTLIARSAAIDHVRRRRTREVAHEGLERAADPAGPTPERSPVETPELPLHVLTARQRLVLRMLFDEEMSVPEAAAVLGVDEQTIRSTKHKAISRLRDLLT
jgi:RNA polymerase sigma-70 factor (ECF subfamily)